MNTQVPIRYKAVAERTRRFISTRPSVTLKAAKAQLASSRKQLGLDRMPPRKLTTEEFDLLAETGQSLVPHLKVKTVRRVNRGGVRPGAGRKRSGRSSRTVRLADGLWKTLDAEAARTGLSVSTIIERRVAHGRKTGGVV